MNTNERLRLENESTGVNVNFNQIQGTIVKQKFDLNYFELYKAYAIYDQAGVCTHGILISVNENVLTFCTYGNHGNGRADLYDIDDYIEGKFTIKPLVEKEQ